MADPVIQRPEAQQMVFDKYHDGLMGRLRDSGETAELAVIECATNAAGYIAMLMESVKVLNKTITKQKERIIEQKLLLDEADSHMTCETYALKVLHNKITRAKAGQITKNLKKAGYVPDGLVTAKYDPGMQATLWSRDYLHHAYRMGWFFGNGGVPVPDMPYLPDDEVF